MTSTEIPDHERDDPSGVVESSTHPDYAAVDLPQKDRTAYSYVERRAELLQLIQQAGHPDALNQTQLAEHFDVSQQQISKDLDRLESYIRENLGERRDLVSLSVYDRAIIELFNEGEPYKAAQVASMREEYLSSREWDVDLKHRITRLEELEERGKYR